MEMRQNEITNTYGICAHPFASKVMEIPRDKIQNFTMQQLRQEQYHSVRLWAAPLITTCGSLTFRLCFCVEHGLVHGGDARLGGHVCLRLFISLLLQHLHPPLQHSLLIIIQCNLEEERGDIVDDGKEREAKVAIFFIRRKIQLDTFNRTSRDNRK